MTMTPERLAELDAVMAKVRAFPFGSEEWEVAFILARLAAYNAYPDLRAHIEAQAATIARLTEGLDKLAVELREYAGKWRDEGCDSQRVAHVARALGNYADDVSTNRYGAA